MKTNTLYLGVAVFSILTVFYTCALIAWIYGGFTIFTHTEIVNQKDLAITLPTQVVQQPIIQQQIIERNNTIIIKPNVGWNCEEVSNSEKTHLTCTKV